MPTAAGTPPTVEKILQDHGATDDELGEAALATTWDGQPLISVLQLGGKTDTEGEARAKAQTISKRPAMVEALVAAWKQAGGGASSKPPPSKPPPGGAGATPLKRTDPPPAQTADISGWPNITTNPGTPDALQFTMPPILSAAGGAHPKPVQISALSWTDWVRIAFNCNLSKALKLEPSGMTRPLPPAFQWKLRPDDGFVDVVTSSDFPDGGLTTSLSFTSENHTALSQGVLDGSLQAGYWFVTATAQATWKSKVAEQQASRRLYLSFRDTHPVCRLYLPSCLQASSGFQEAITKALDDDDAFAALSQVLDNFGHVVPASVVIGAAFVFETTRNIEQWTAAQEADLKTNFSLACGETKAAAPKSGKTKPAALDSPSPPTAGASASISWDSENKDWNSKDSLRERLRSYPIGGDENQRDWRSWLDTVGAPDGWRVIYHEGGLLPDPARGDPATKVHRFLSVLEFLPDQLQQKVDSLWKAGCRKAWGIGTARLVDKTPNLALFPTPLFWSASGGPQAVTLVNRDAGAPQVLQAANGVTDTMPASRDRIIPEQAEPDFGPIAPIPAQQIPQHPYQPEGWSRTSGKYWVNCDPAPLRITTAAAADAKQANALWRFEYTGDLTLDDDPLYWIVSQDGAWLLAGFTQEDVPPSFQVSGLKAGDSWACLLASAARRQVLPGQSTAAWIVYPADPAGFWGAAYKDHYLLRNHVLGSFLGSEGDLVSSCAWQEYEHTEKYWRKTALYFYNSSCVIDEKLVSYREWGEPASFRRSKMTTPAKGISDIYGLSADELNKICWQILPYQERGPGYVSDWSQGVDAAINLKSAGKIYFFNWNQYTRLTDIKVDPNYPQELPGEWQGLPASWNSGIDAAIYHESRGKSYFFKGSQYVRLTGTKVDSNYPVELPGGWQGLPASWNSGIDAAFYYEPTAKVYFF